MCVCVYIYTYTYTHIYIIESLCCTAEIGITHINYNRKNKNLKKKTEPTNH